MIASSVFVLAALTMTGIYMKSNNTEEQGDGYTIDFTALEDNVEDKHEEIAQNKPVEEKADRTARQIKEILRFCKVGRFHYENCCRH